MSNERKSSFKNYAKDIEKGIIKARLSSVDGSMLEFAKMLTVMKGKRLYKLLGFKTFKEWFGYWGFPKPTVYTWLKIHSTFVMRHKFTEDDLVKVEVRVLKALLPVAHTEVATKERLTKIMNEAKQLEFTKFLNLLPEIKRSFGLEKEC